ncbi:elongation factor G [Streptomyces profundus]|uniref:elongation factor G n=1 Tax=Streptomyces profundus TaxID=2867410 RepID=UPI001D167DCD|nr:TetM/TetW/TetO/TetS family tetracycline resistance ribosomal protection protein [Streptomyces sp. MA3_2.13]UED85545.1 TetM/TetW/TetO/TetS family tetracycline resistance ribosomal protection protein [Streptomyces sp. MA3_2.13]
MRIVNLGVLAHVDAGKTSLTERLLYDTGRIDRLGSVDAGSTQTDSTDIERRRGITVRSAVTSFRIDDRQVNLIDTPGHSDFVAEVERALTVLDGAVLLLSAVEGVQAHTRVLMRVLKELRLPTLIFVNKIDRPGARAGELVADIRRSLTAQVVPMGTVRGTGTPGAAFDAFPVTGGAVAEAWAPVLAEHDASILAALVEERTVEPARLAEALTAQVAEGKAFPLLWGSALSGAGIPALLAAIAELLPPGPAPEARLRCRVFAIDRDVSGEKVAYLRSYGGELRERQRVTGYRQEADGTVGSYRARVSGLRVVGAPAGGEHRLTARHIARVRGLAQVRIGDELGSPEAVDRRPRFPPPSLETVVTARDGARSGALHAALLSMADQDPLIQARVTPDGETRLLLYGEVQREVIATTLADTHGIEAVFAPARVVHRERPAGVGSAVEFIGNGFLATVGLRVEPGEGVSYHREVELGSMPVSFHTAVEETVYRALGQGNHGWPVTDVRVTLTHSGFWPRPYSTAGAYRDLTPHVLLQALAAAGTRVYEPCHAFHLEAPADRLGPLTARLVGIGARLDTPVEVGAAWQLTGELPTRVVHDFQRSLPTLTGGEGVWYARQAGDREVAGRPPRRERTDGNPADRAEYTRFLSHRTPAS